VTIREVRVYTVEELRRIQDILGGRINGRLPEGLHEVSGGPGTRKTPSLECNINEVIT